jgi:hypothetical protein
MNKNKNLEEKKFLIFLINFFFLHLTGKDSSSISNYPS